MKPPRVIVVDDEEDVAGYLAAALEDAGLDVAAFTEAAPALSAILRERPALVCLDLLMPGHTGLWLYRRLREAAELRDVAVLVVTGLGLKDGLRSLMPAGQPLDLPEPEAWIEKPVDLEKLRAAVRRLTSAPAEGAP